MSEAEKYVDQATLAAAVEKHQAANEALKLAGVEMSKATESLDTATAAHAAAIAEAAKTGSAQRPVALEKAKAEAEADYKHVSSIHEAAQKRLAETATAHRTALKAAHMPVLQEAARRRVAAAGEFEAAAKAMAQAVEAYEATGELIAYAGLNGAALPFDGALLAPQVHHHTATQPPGMRRTLRTAQAEAALWEGVL